MIIPSDTPVQNRHLLELKSALGLKTYQWIFVFGLTPTKWAKMAQDARQTLLSGQIVRDPRIALLARWLDVHPDQLPDILGLQPEAFYRAFCQANRRLTLREFSLLLGCHETAGYRWVTKGSPAAPIVTNILSILCTDTAPTLVGNWINWRSMAIEEARLRGIPNLLSIGSWQTPTKAAA